MTADDSTGGTRLLWLATAIGGALLVVCCLGTAVISVSAGAGSATQQAGGSQLRPDAPVPPQYLAAVLRAGAMCAPIGPAEIAAQIDLESSWNPNAYADY